MEYLFGVDIGGTTVKIGLVSVDGKILDKFEIKTNTNDEGKAILPDVKEAIYRYIDEHHLDKSAIKGIGFGVPGPVSNNVVQKCVNLGWGFKNVKEEFESLIDFKTNIAVGNDANVAALGEMSQNHQYQSIVMFTLGTGVGGGIILNGRPLDGTHGCGGELGHLPIALEHNYHCNCGLDGCLETVASATGVVRLTREYLGSFKSSLDSLNPDEITCKDVFDAAKLNDPLGLKVLEEVGYYMGKAAAIVAATCDPEAFIIGGGVSKAGQILIDAISKHYQKFAFHKLKNVPFILATLGNDGGMLGAALLSRI